MRELEERIVRDGIVKAGNVLKVDAFLNHQCDVEWARLFEGAGINKILTIEASGIGIACCASRHFGNVPVVFAKKAQSINLDGEQYSTTIYSFTKQKEYPVIVGRRFLESGDRVLIIDDFLANGCALEGLISICESAGAEVAGIGIAIEKGYQGGGDKLRARGYRVESLARIAGMDDETGEIVFA
jgi:xanthine phosphoribosyltransferase